MEEVAQDSHPYQKGGRTLHAGSLSGQLPGRGQGQAHWLREVLMDIACTNRKVTSCIHLGTVASGECTTSRPAFKQGQALACKLVRVLPCEWSHDQVQG